MEAMKELCPCGSGLAYGVCCGPYIAGELNPISAEALMRSRYTAYVKHAIDYLIDTCLDGQKRNNRSKTAEWSDKSKWLGLNILSVSDGKDGNIGTVVFEALYEQKGLMYTHHETARFKKVDNRWYYDDGVVEIRTITRNGPKVGRNDPCPCGSGKKYKHCCGK